MGKMDFFVYMHSLFYDPYIPVQNTLFLSSLNKQFYLFVKKLYTV